MARGPSAATASAAAPAGRKLRVLALHGGASNSNVMKFQTSRLKRALGREAEWFFPDGPVPWEQNRAALLRAHQEAGVEVPSGSWRDLYFAERSDVEKRLAQGKPFFSWIEVDGLGDDMFITPQSFDRGIQWLEAYVEEQAPIDVVVAFSQVSGMVVDAVFSYHRKGRKAPWHFNLFFGGIPLDWQVHHERRDLQPSLQPTFLVLSPEDPFYEMSKWSIQGVFLKLAVLDHKDGYGFPTTDPEAANVYSQIAADIKAFREEQLGGEGGAAPGFAPAAASSGGAPRGELARASRQRIAEAGGVWHKVLGISPDARTDEVRRAFRELALLHHPDKNPDLSEDDTFKCVQRAYEEAQAHCMGQQGHGAVQLAKTSAPAASPGDSAQAGEDIEDLREAARERIMQWEMRCRGEGTEPDDIQRIKPQELAEGVASGSLLVVDVREDEERRGWQFPGAATNATFLDIKMRPFDTGKTLSRWRRDRRPIVAISISGERCKQYGAILVDIFEFPSHRVFCLEGGMRAWDLWERGNPEMVRCLRQMFNAAAPTRSRLERPDSPGALA